MFSALLRSTLLLVLAGSLRWAPPSSGIYGALYNTGLPELKLTKLSCLVGLGTKRSLHDILLLDGREPATGRRDVLSDVSCWRVWSGVMWSCGLV